RGAEPGLGAGRGLRGGRRPGRRGNEGSDEGAEGGKWHGGASYSAAHRSRRPFQPGSGPVATLAAGWLLQSLQDPTYSLAPGKPASSSASKVWQAVTPLPQEATTSAAWAAPSRWYRARSSSGGRNRPSFRFPLTGALTA